MIYKRLLKEADGQTADLALYINRDSRWELTLVLYDVSTLKNLKYIYDYEVIRDSIVGFIELGVSYGGRPNGAATVMGSWVKNPGTGMGRNMYRYAMAVAPNNTIMSDRSQVSPSALRIWLSLIRDPQVERKAIDDRGHPRAGTNSFHDDHHTVDPSDDGLTLNSNSPALAGLSGDALRLAIDALNHTASSTAWIGDVEALRKNHRSAFPNLARKDRTEEILLQAARRNFSESLGREE